MNRTIYNTRNVMTVVRSLVSGSNRSERSNDFRPAIDFAKKSPAEPPYNALDDIISSFADIIETRIKGSDNWEDNARPYWMPEGRYCPIEVFYATIQFIDDHRAPLPQTVLPPERDVRAYIDRVLSSDRKLLLPDQLTILLDITGNNLIGAANLAFVVSRLLSRASEFRAYPAIDDWLEQEHILTWGCIMTDFVSNTDAPQSDAPGDTYYFWTQFFTALYYGSAKGVSMKASSCMFAHGPRIMLMARNYLARATTASHEYAASAGWKAGFKAIRLLDCPTEVDRTEHG